MPAMVPWDRAVATFYMLSVVTMHPFVSCPVTVASVCNEGVFCRLMADLVGRSISRCPQPAGFQRVQDLRHLLGVHSRRCRENATHFSG